MSVYDYIVQTASGKEQALAEYQGKVLLIVNTASIMTKGWKFWLFRVINSLTRNPAQMRKFNPSAS